MKLGLWSLVFELGAWCFGLNEFSLQRSEMFIDSATNSLARAPAERDVSANGTW